MGKHSPPPLRALSTGATPSHPSQTIPAKIPSEYICVYSFYPETTCSHFNSHFRNGSAPTRNRTFKTSHPGSRANGEGHACTSRSQYRPCHRESGDTFATVTLHSHCPMSVWSVCPCLCSTTVFLSIASHIQYIYITLHFAPTFFLFPCSVFFSFYIFVGDEGVAMREGGTCGSRL
jgi:hypothetical protein